MAHIYTKKEMKERIAEVKRELKERTKKKVKDPEESYYAMQFRKAKLVWSQMSPIRKACLKSSMQKDSDGVRYQCNSCKRWFAYSDIQVDHIEAIGKTSPKNIEEYIKHFILLNSSFLQILCKSVCHNKKTKEDIVKIKESKK